MLSDGFRYLEGSVNTNLTLPLTTSLSSVYTPNEGEIVYLTEGTNPGFYVYNGVRWLCVLRTVTNNTSGKVILDIETLPGFTGDVTASIGSNTLTLKQILPALAGKTGIFNSVTVNEKGLVVGGIKYTNLTDMGITSDDGLLSSFVGSSDKGVADGIAGLDSTAHLLVQNLPAFAGGDVVSIAGSNKLALNKIYKPFTPSNPSDIDPKISISGQYNLVTVNDNGLIIDGQKLESYTKNEIDNLLGTAVFEIPDATITVGSVVEPIDITNLLRAISNYPNIVSAIRGSIVLFTALGISYIRKQVTIGNPLSDWIELPQILNNINGAQVHKLLVSDIHLINTSPKLQLVTRTDSDKKFTLPAAKTLPLGGPVFVFKNMDPNNRFHVYSHNGKLLTYVDAITDVSVYLSGNTDDDWAFIIQSSKDHEFIENKSTNINLVDPISLVSSDKLYPTQRAVKQYVTDTIKRDILDLKGRSELVIGATPPRLKTPGFATLDVNNFLTLSQLPPEAINNTYSIPNTFIDNHIYVTVTRANYLDAINAYAVANHITYRTGDICIIDILKKVYILQSSNPNVFVELASGVLSIHNKVGDLHLDASDIETGVFDKARIPNINYINDVHDNSYISTDLVLTNESAPIQLLKTLSTGIDVILPNSTTMSSVGVRFVIKNTGISTGTTPDKFFNIKSSNGTVLYPLYPNQSVNILLSDIINDSVDSWTVIGQATYHRFAELDKSARLVTIQLPAFVGDVISSGGNNTLTLKDAPFYNSSYVENFYEYTKISRAGIALDVKNKVFTISDISKLPAVTDSNFDPTAKYLIADSAFSYRWDGARYVLDDDLLASHVYIINTIDAEKPDIILPNSPALLAKPNDIVFVRALKKSFILTGSDATVLRNWVQLTYEGNYVCDTTITVPLIADIVLDKDSPQFQLFKTATLNGTSHWKFTLPVARTLSLGGMLFVFKNTGDPTDKPVDIISSTGELVYTINPGRFISLYLNSFDNHTGWEVGELTSGTELLKNKNQPFGYAGLDQDGLLPYSLMPLSYQMQRHSIEIITTDVVVPKNKKTIIYIPTVPYLRVSMNISTDYELGNIQHVLQNKGAYPLTILTYTGESIAVLKPRATLTVLLIDQTTPEGIWVPLVGEQTLTTIVKHPEVNLGINSNTIKVVYLTDSSVYLLYVDSGNNLIGCPINIVNNEPVLGSPTIISSVITSVFSATSLTPNSVLIVFADQAKWLSFQVIYTNTNTTSIVTDYDIGQNAIIDNLIAIDSTQAILVFRTEDLMSSCVIVDTGSLPTTAIIIWDRVDISSALGSIDVAPISLHQIAVVFTINGLLRIGAFVLSHVNLDVQLSVCYEIAPEPATDIALTTLGTNTALCTYIDQDHNVVLALLKNATYSASGSSYNANVLMVSTKIILTGNIAKKVSVTALTGGYVICSILNDGNYINVYSLTVSETAINIIDKIEIINTGSNSSLDACALSDSAALITYNGPTNNLTSKYIIAH